MSLGFTVRVLESADPKTLMKRLGEPSGASGHKPELRFFEILTGDGRYWEREGVDTLVSIPCDKRAEIEPQRRAVIAAVESLMRSGPEDVALSFNDRLLVRRIAGRVEWFNGAEPAET